MQDGARRITTLGRKTRRDIDAELELLRGPIDAIHRALECSSESDVAFDEGALALSSLWPRLCDDDCDDELPHVDGDTPCEDPKQQVPRRRAATAFRLLWLEEERQAREAGKATFAAHFDADFAARDAVIDGLSVEELRRRLKCFERIRALRAHYATYDTFSALGDVIRPVLLELERSRDEASPPCPEQQDEDWDLDKRVPLSRWRQLLVDAWRNGIPDGPADYRSAWQVVGGWDLQQCMFVIGGMYVDDHGEIVRKRAFAWEPTLAAAEEWALDPPDWVMEGGHYYNLVMVEQVFHGPCFPGARYWYEPTAWAEAPCAHGRTRRIITAMKRIDPPPWSKRIACWWIG